MTDWLDDLVSKKREQLAAKRLKDEKDLSDLRMQDAHGATMWQEVQNTVEKAIFRYNETLGQDYISFARYADGHSFSLKVGTQLCEIRFHPEQRLITNQWKSFKLRVVEGNEVVWQIPDGKETYTSEQVARMLVT
jgi:hypothetical protein